MKKKFIFLCISAILMMIVLGVTDEREYSMMHYIDDCYTTADGKYYIQIHSRLDRRNDVRMKQGENYDAVVMITAYKLTGTGLALRENGREIFTRKCSFDDHLQVGFEEVSDDEIVLTINDKNKPMKVKILWGMMFP